MTKGVRQNVKSCPRMEKRLLPPWTHHNTQRLMTAPQPGRTQVEETDFFFFLLTVETEDLKEGLACVQISVTNIWRHI